MGMLVCVILGFGVTPHRHVPRAHHRRLGPHATATRRRRSRCPCERIVYRGGVLNVAFTALCGLMLIGVAAWFLWELWSAVEPKPITDDFLKLLNDSFGRDWRNPLTWPWARVLWAYGFTVVGATLTAGVGVMIWTLVASSDAAKAPTGRIETSQSFRLGR